MIRLQITYGFKILFMRRKMTGWSNNTFSYAEINHIPNVLGQLRSIPEKSMWSLETNFFNDTLDAKKKLAIAHIINLVADEKENKLFSLQCYICRKSLHHLSVSSVHIESYLFCPGPNMAPQETSILVWFVSFLSLENSSTIQ